MINMNLLYSSRYTTLGTSENRCKADSTGQLQQRKSPARTKSIAIIFFHLGVDACLAMGKNVRVPVSSQSCLPHFVGFHHVIMFLIVFAIAVTAILLAGAGPTSVAQSVYLVQLNYVNFKDSSHVPMDAWENITFPAIELVKDTQLAVRLGYFGLCAAQNDDSWICRRSASKLAMTQQFVDPLGMIGMAERIKDDVVFSGFLLGSTCLGILSLLLFSTFPGWHSEQDEITGSEIDVKPFPSRGILAACIASTGVALLFVFTSALWQHTAAVTSATLLETMSISTIKAGVGAVAVALAWIVFGLWVIVFLMETLMLVSMRILDILTDNEFPDDRSIEQRRSRESLLF